VLPDIQKPFIPGELQVAPTSELVLLSYILPEVPELEEYTVHVGSAILVALKNIGVTACVPGDWLIITPEEVLDVPGAVPMS